MSAGSRSSGSRATPRGPRHCRGSIPAFIRFTSGTTAHSKGVVLSHEATAARVRAADAVLRFSEEDRILWVLPLAYHFAVTIVAYVRAGAHVLLCPDTLPAALADAMRAARAQRALRLARFTSSDWVTCRPRRRPAALRLALSTSAPIAAAVMERFESAYGVPVGQAYGLIEAGLPCINTRTDGLPATSVGRPVPGYEVAVLSDGGHAAIGAGATGRDRRARRRPVRRVLRAVAAPRRTSARDGWFMTGDIGWLDDRGRAASQGSPEGGHLRGRAEVLSRGGGGLHQRSSLASKESRVFGRPHPRLGESPQRGDRHRARAATRRRSGRTAPAPLSSWKVPLEFAVVAEIPRSPGGRILRRSFT